MESKKENYILKFFNYISNNFIQKNLVSAPLVVQTVQRLSQWMKFSANIHNSAEVLLKLHINECISHLRSGFLAFEIHKYVCLLFITESSYLGFYINECICHPWMGRS